MKNLILKSFLNLLSTFIHVMAKLSCYFILGLGSILVSITLFPILKIFVHPWERFARLCRRFISCTLRWYFKYMQLVKVAKIEVSDLEKLKSLKSAIVVANHPSMLDSVLLISFLPCTDFIVKASLKKRNVLGGIVRNLYIPNSMDYDVVLERCKENLAAGGTLTLFPEGTRSPASGQKPFKKGAARVSLATGCPILPVHIGGNEKRGLRKHDSFFWIPKEKTYRYVFTVGDFVYPDEYRDLPDPIAAKRYTEKLQEILADKNY